MDQFATQIEPDPIPSPTGGLKGFLIELVQTVLIAVLLFLGINALTARIRVQSVSMQPTLYEKDFVLINKVIYKFGPPKRGDVIVFHPPLDPEGEPFVKRIIGLPGDTVKVMGGQVFANDIPLTEPYIQSTPLYQGEWQVPEGQIFVLGDNRNNSSDSHQWGMVPLENIIGRAEFVYFPFVHWQLLHPAVAVAAPP
jgi:signal peptidase I